jgi:hypothetical protein
MPKHSFKRIAAFVVLGVACVGLWFTYVPGHWLTRVKFGTVTVDDHPAQADVYIGHPTQNEAEAIAFVHVPAVGDYFLDFEGEAYREASNHEFVRFSVSVRRNSCLVADARERPEWTAFDKRYGAFQWAERHARSSPVARRAESADGWIEPGPVFAR